MEAGSLSNPNNIQLVSSNRGDEYWSPHRKVAKILNLFSFFTIKWQITEKIRVSLYKFISFFKLWYPPNMTTRDGEMELISK